MTAAISTKNNNVRLKAVAIPAEHGGWGFLLEAILLGLLAAPSAAGFALSVAMLGGFLMRHPFKLMMIDRRRGKRYARTILAMRFALLYAGIAAVGGLAATALAGTAFLVPLVAAILFAGIQITFDGRSESRHWIPELAGPLALSGGGAGILMAGGWPLPPALAAGTLLAARSLPAVLYARARLRLERGQQPSLIPSIAAHALSVGAAVLLVGVGTAPALSVFAMIILLLRAIYGLSPYRRPAAPKVLGFQEIAFGVITVILIAIGYIHNI